MNEKVETDGNRLDTLKLGVAVLLLAGAIIAFYYFDEQSQLLRVVGLLALTAISVAVAAQSNTGRKIIGFIAGAKKEVQRVVWPTRTETTQTTLAVLVIVLIMGILLWLLDMVLLAAIQMLTGQGG